MMENSYEFAGCCIQMADKIDEDNLLCYREHISSSSRREGPAIYIMSDEGRKGIAKIRYCPFCGTQVSFFARGN